MALNENIGSLDDDELTQQFPSFYKKLASSINSKAGKQVIQITAKATTPVMSVDPQEPCLIFVVRANATKDFGLFLAYNNKIGLVSVLGTNNFGAKITNESLFLNAGEYFVTKMPVL